MRSGSHPAERWGYHGPDHSTGPGAEQLARRIERFWAERGRAVQCQVVLALKQHCEPQVSARVYGVRSDLIMGLPNTPFGPRWHGRKGRSRG